jgi:hypothetical protein
MAEAAEAAAQRKAGHGGAAAQGTDAMRSTWDERFGGAAKYGHCAAAEGTGSARDRRSCAAEGTSSARDRHGGAAEGTSSATKQRTQTS